jgi:GNAT superfamily N-acetyltransferase
MHTGIMALELTVDPDLTDKLRAEIVACWTDVSNAGGAVGFVPPVAMDDVLPVAAKVFAGLDAGRDRLIVGRETGTAEGGGGASQRGGGGHVRDRGGSVGSDGGSGAGHGRDGGGVGGDNVSDAGRAGASGGGGGGGGGRDGRTGDGAVSVDGGRLAALAVIADGQFRLTEHWRTVKRVMVHPDFQGRGYGAQLMAEVERTARAMGLELLTLDCRSDTGNDEFYKKCGYVEFGRLPGGLRLGPDDYRDQILMTLTLRR